MINASVITVFAFLCAALMGLAVQRGGTCAVAAVEEVVVQGDSRRFRALVEAAFWSAGLMAVAYLVFGKAIPARPYGITEWTVFGGMLLGLGAWINGACVFGSVAAFGAGDWAYAFFPVGFGLGCYSFDGVARFLGLVLPEALPASAVFLNLVPFVATLFLGWLGLRGWQLWVAVARRARDHTHWDVLRGEWPLHVGTIVVSVAFVAMAITYGHWVYTDAVAEVARGQTPLADSRLWLFGAMLLGSLAGGISLRKWSPVLPKPGTIAKCLLGGGVMAFGFLLVPGANDSIILLGLPTLQPQAWVGMVSMCLTLALLIFLKRRWQTR